MTELFGDKSHEPTPHRRQQARREGHAARSQDLASAIVWIAAALILTYSGRGIAQFMGELTQRQLGGRAWLVADANILVAELNGMLLGLGRVLLPIVGLLLLAAVLVHVGQVGFLFLPHRLAFDLARIDPLQGAARLFSLSSLIRLGLGILKMIVVAAVGAWSLWGQRTMILSLGQFEVPQIATFLVEVMLWTSLHIGVALLALAVLDYAYQRWKHEQDLRMTTQELREELKSLQGDPQFIIRRRAVQRRLSVDRATSGSGQ
jgi:flagellar biosynthetic protein FlhB